MLTKLTAFAAAGIFVLSTATASAADRPLSVKDELTRTECGDCHMVFPSTRLTKNAWKKIMATLDDHFGDDASLDAATAKHIEAYLVENAMDAKMGIRTKMRLAAWKKKGIVDVLRITELPEWTRHHNTNKYKFMVKDVGYARGSNCIRCHKGAETGLYEEFDDRYPQFGGGD